MIETIIKILLPLAKYILERYIKTKANKEILIKEFDTFYGKLQKSSSKIGQESDNFDTLP